MDLCLVDFLHCLILWLSCTFSCSFMLILYLNPFIYRFCKLCVLMNCTQFTALDFQQYMPTNDKVLDILIEMYLLDPLRIHLPLIGKVNLIFDTKLNKHKLILIDMYDSIRRMTTIGQIISFPITFVHTFVLEGYW
ncbi:hypothetical protein C7212DRAFT_342591 [Tuber magnatum]|uniref:Uncharacterized protein n=1 Tax=Tuber magnatum TaxID=42249 RepID=A0A317STK5_9PEZI|nr:hypothetical protein C7212DRAFT_342591 [Tuber magnatum]